MIDIRRRPAFWVVAQMKRLRVRQMDIALKADVSTSFVNRVIKRDPTTDPQKRERVWKEIERVLEHAA